MKNLFIVFIALAFVGGAYVLLKKPASVMQPVSTPTAAPTQASETTGGTMEKSPVKEFTVTANSNFRFDPAEIKVKKGNTVKIVFKNSGAFHDWVLDEFNVRTKQIPDGGTETIQFVADKTGTFEYYCSVGDHRAKGMVGKLIVE